VSIHDWVMFMRGFLAMEVVAIVIVEIHMRLHHRRH